MEKTSTQTPPSKAEMLVAIANRMLRMREGPKRDRLERAIRAGLLAPGPLGDVAGTLRRALECATLAEIALKGAERGAGEERRSLAPNDLRDPTDLLAYLTQAYEQLDQVLALVAEELERVEARPAASMVRAA